MCNTSNCFLGLINLCTSIWVFFLKKQTNKYKLLIKSGALFYL